ncbi:MAG: Gfo/Idh/MocA family oxidoreductase [Propionibacteriaceae bacterium]|nr:Gfo/Idh/MocA family oxidoreductase [Propionibacteriaceae bacterium]
MSPVRLATIGTSWITTQFADAVARVPGVELAVAYSRDPDRAAAFAAQIGAAGSSADLPGLLASGELDAVYVASPNSAHFDHALAAIRAGKHVLVEKPATPTAAEFATLVAEARAAGVVLLEAMRSAHDPGMARVRELVDEVGPVRRVSLRYSQRSSRYDLVLAGERVNIFDPAMAGGALNDLGVYCVSALVGLFGEPERVVAATVPVSGGADGAGAALASYPGFAADLSWSKITASDVPSEVQGELGTLLIDQIAAPRLLELHRLDGSEVESVVDAPAFDLSPELRAFASLCAGEGDASADHERTLATLRTIEAIRVAAGTPGRGPR